MLCAVLHETFISFYFILLIAAVLFLFVNLIFKFFTIDIQF